MEMGFCSPYTFLSMTIKISTARPKILFFCACFLLAGTLFSNPAVALEKAPLTSLSVHQQLAEDILRELVEFESTSEKPEETRQSLESVARRLIEAGFPERDVVLINPFPDGWGLVARYRGIASQGPLLTMAHIDVVTAEPDAWAFPPFTFGKKNGFYYGRGTQDNKTGVAHIAANFIRLRRENYVPNRDLIMAITGDEETRQDVIAWLTNEGRSLIEADIAINSDAGGGELSEDGTPLSFWIQTGEKLYQSYRLSTSNPGGHSSIPRRENAIDQLAQALVRISAYQFPLELNESNRLMLERSARIEEGQRAADMLAVVNSLDQAAASRLSQDPMMNALLRTTCVVTEIEGGHAENALPRSASATVNCRILPGNHAEAIEKKLREIVNDDAVAFESIYDAIPSPPSAMPAAFLESVEALVEESWPGIPVIPEMSTGATDGLFVRNAGIPVYGVAGWLINLDDIRSHGLDEKIGIRQFHEGTKFWYRMLKEFSQ